MTNQVTSTVFFKKKKTHFSSLLVTIAASSGLSSDEIDRMVQEAEKNAEADRARRDTIEMANRAESTMSETEKAMDDFKDQIDSAEADRLKSQIASLREQTVKAQAGDADIKPEDLKAKIDELQTSSLKLFEMVYKNRANQSDQGNTDGHPQQ